MNLGSDILETIAILDDSAYLRGARRMAQATESIGDNKGWQRLASASTLVGGGLVGLGVKALQTASKFEQMRQSFEVLYGPIKGDNLFAQLKQFTFTTPYTTSDLADDVRLLGNMGVVANQALPDMKALGDAVTAGFGVNPAKLKQATYALAEMNAQFISLRQIRMLTIAGVPAMKYLEEGLHMTSEQLAGIGKLHISGALGAQIILKGIETDPSRIDAMTKHMHTLTGEASNLSDAWQQFLAASGAPALEPAEKAIDRLANMLKSLSSPENSKITGEAILYGGPALLLAGTALPKAISMWQKYAQGKTLARIAAIAEKDAELAKLPVLAKEGEAVAGATGKWSKLGMQLSSAEDRLAAFGKASGAAELGAEGLLGELGVGILTLGAYGVAIAGIGVVLYELVGTYQALADASSTWEQSIAAVNDAKAKGYDVSGGQPTGFAALPAWKQDAELGANSLANWATYGLWQPFNTDPGSTALIDPDWAKKHAGQGMVPSGVRSQLYGGIPGATGDDGDDDGTGTGKKKKVKPYELPEQYKYLIASDERHLELLKAQDATQQQINAAKAIEVGHLEKAGQMLLHNARLTANANDRYKLLGESDEDFQKAAMMYLDKTDKRSALDKYSAKIIDSVGFSDDDAIKMGVNRRMLSQYGQKGTAATSTAGVLANIARARPMIFQIQVGNKTVETITKSVTDEVMRQMIEILTGSHLGSQLSVK